MLRIPNSSKNVPTPAVAVIRDSPSLMPERKFIWVEVRIQDVAMGHGDRVLTMIAHRPQGTHCSKRGSRWGVKCGHQTVYNIHNVWKESSIIRWVQTQTLSSPPPPPKKKKKRKTPHKCIVRQQRTVSITVPPHILSSQDLNPFDQQGVSQAEHD